MSEKFWIALIKSKDKYYMACQRDEIPYIRLRAEDALSDLHLTYIDSTTFDAEKLSLSTRFAKMSLSEISDKLLQAEKITKCKLKTLHGMLNAVECIGSEVAEIYNNAIPNKNNNLFK